ncbi:LOW QUALITY PROTEIN: hypothetical protein ACHAWU_003343 [Discostella pseudostelligera]|uniref:Uncharacterized protein n=1 Tax=Discostella pseudostelligera TaxID=259834 RepID=A0ABD3NAW5_9STRA
MPVCKVSILNLKLKRTWLLLFLLAILASPILPLDHDEDENGALRVSGSNSVIVTTSPEHDGLDFDDNDDDVTTFASAQGVDRSGNDNATTKYSNNNNSIITRGLPTTTFLRKSTNKKSREIFHKAFSKAMGGGITGAIAGVVQVLALMWLRTVTNYQYRYGSSFIQALTALYGMGYDSLSSIRSWIINFNMYLIVSSHKTASSKGGIPRLYSGISFALIQAPLSRFVSTAANDGVSALLESYNWGPGREVLVAAVVVGFFRIMLMPIDTCKTVLQIESKKGLGELMKRVRRGNIHLLFSGSLANAASSFIGHYPWFYTYNLLSRNAAFIQLFPWVTGRNALIGFISSIISDTVANFMRVIKTSKQALGSTRSDITYAETISMILAVDGWRGLFGRGLKTRILGNALQSILFTVIWRSLSERWNQVDAETDMAEESSANVIIDDDTDDSENDEYDVER